MNTRSRLWEQQRIIQNFKLVFYSLLEIARFRILEERGVQNKLKDGTPFLKMGGGDGNVFHHKVCNTPTLTLLAWE